MFAVKPRTLVKTDARLSPSWRIRFADATGRFYPANISILLFPLVFPLSFLRIFKFSPSMVGSIHADVAIRLVGEHARTLLAATATKPTRFASRPPTASPKIVEWIKKANEHKGRGERLDNRPFPRTAKLLSSNQVSLFFCNSRFLRRV